jgi:ubiquinone/menaquinone biosynthesis methyltransferase
MTSQVTDVSKSPDRIAGMFDAIAGKYDFLNHLLSAGIDRRWRRRAIRALALTGSERVHDHCTGTADLAIAAIDARPGARRVVGVDFASAMLEVGITKLRERHLDRSVTLVRGDAMRIPVATGSIDAVTVAFGIRNVENTAQACSEIFRVLAPGGRLAVLNLRCRDAALGSVGVSIASPGISGWCLGMPPRLPSSLGGAFASPSEFAKFCTGRGFADIDAAHSHLASSISTRQ